MNNLRSTHLSLMLESDKHICHAKTYFRLMLWTLFVLIHGESDDLPGLIVDRYAEWLVVQFLSSGSEHWRREIIDALVSEVQPRGIFERSDADVRELEGLEPQIGLLWGDAPPALLEIHLHGLRYWVDLYSGHKTGYYLDQRENHTIVKKFADGKDVLDCFCYTGSFSVGALAAGAASVTAVDSSADALALTEKNIALNGLEERRFSKIQGDVFQILRKMRDERKSFDLIVLDPPKFAPTVFTGRAGGKQATKISICWHSNCSDREEFCSLFLVRGVWIWRYFKKLSPGQRLDAGVDAQDHPMSPPGS